MELVENHPLDPGRIASLITDKHDLFLVWPIAKWPFDPDQWREALDPAKGHVSFIVCEHGRAIGHAALRKSDSPGTYKVAFLYLLPEFRNEGLGHCMVTALEHYALHRLGAKRLRLVVRDYNPRAIKCYLQCGFRETGREGTRIDMQKELPEQTADGQPSPACEAATRAVHED